MKLPLFQTYFNTVMNRVATTASKRTHFVSQYKVSNGSSTVMYLFIVYLMTPSVVQNIKCQMIHLIKN